MTDEPGFVDRPRGGNGQEERRKEILEESRAFLIALRESKRASGACVRARQELRIFRSSDE